MFVTDDEAERLALETVQQLAEIEPNFDELGDAEDLSNLQTKKTDENIQTTIYGASINFYQNQPTLRHQI